MKNEKDEWTYQMNLVKNLLENNDALKWLYDAVCLALNIGFDKIRLAYEIKNKEFDYDYLESEKIKTEKIRQLDNRLVDEYNLIKSFIITHFYYAPRIKKIDFGENTEEYLIQIRTAVLERKPIKLKSELGENTIFFEYEPNDSNNYWYFEINNYGNPINEEFYAVDTENIIALKKNIKW